MNNKLTIFVDSGEKLEFETPEIRNLKEAESFLNNKITPTLWNFPDCWHYKIKCQNKYLRKILRLAIGKSGVKFIK